MNVEELWIDSVDINDILNQYDTAECKRAIASLIADIILLKAALNIKITKES